VNKAIHTGIADPIMDEYKKFHSMTRDYEVKKLNDLGLYSRRFDLTDNYNPTAGRRSLNYLGSSLDDQRWLRQSKILVQGNGKTINYNAMYDSWFQGFASQNLVGELNSTTWLDGAAGENTWGFDNELTKVMSSLNPNGTGDSWAAFANNIGAAIFYAPVVETLHWDVGGDRFFNINGLYGLEKDQYGIRGRVLDRTVQTRFTFNEWDYSAIDYFADEIMIGGLGNSVVLGIDNVNDAFAFQIEDKGVAVSLAEDVMNRNHGVNFSVGPLLFNARVDEADIINSRSSTSVGIGFPSFLFVESQLGIDETGMLFGATEVMGLGNAVTVDMTVDLLGRFVWIYSFVFGDKHYMWESTMTPLSWFPHTDLASEKLTLENIGTRMDQLLNPDTIVKNLAAIQQNPFLDDILCVGNAWGCKPETNIQYEYQGNGVFIEV